MELLPAIDLRNGQVVRLLRGDYDRQTTYAVDPVAMAERFAAAGCHWLHLVDLDGARNGRPVNLPIIEKLIRSTALQVQVGGGIRDEEMMEYLLAIGAQRVVLGTRAMADPEWCRQTVQDARFRGRVVLGLDARDGRVSTHGWTSHLNNPTISEIVGRLANWPLAALVYTDVSRDGTLSGPNVAATEQLLRQVKSIPVIHSGGVASLADLAALKRLPLAGVIVGRAIYEWTIDVRQAVEKLRDN